MHLGLIDGPVVPHNLISTQESPVLLLNFQMAARLKILMASASKKGNQIYFSFLSKVPANEPPPGSPKGPYGEGGPFTGNLSYLSKTSSFGFSNRTPMERDTRLQGRVNHNFTFTQIFKKVQELSQNFRSQKLHFNRNCTLMIHKL